MSNDKTGGPASPQPCTGYPFEMAGGGMTLRDYFAAKALPLAWAAFTDGYYECDAGSINISVAECAYQMADAMLKARDGVKP